MFGYVKHFDSSKTMSFRVNDKKLLKKFTKIWENIEILNLVMEMLVNI